MASISTSSAYVSSIAIIGLFALTAGTFVGAMPLNQLFSAFRHNKINSKDRNNKRDVLASPKTSAFGNSVEGNLIRPPFPKAIRDMLSTARLAYLSTVNDNSAHLCLMRFTYLKDEEDGEVVILSTQRNTKKFDMLTKQRGVALLVHDFEQHDRVNENNGVQTITMNGECCILEDGEKAEYYRAKHLKHNPEYPQFIVGDDIAILCIFVQSARICNVNDQVTRWNVTDK
eukprot:CAMPEP_0194086430 /NCGR_PEP_ID=MMETSP0149-20130528/21114_1 /TAXON_ID=122233 /ORGANISM="Chaetoceros debilis, Strain MM31A-1" /LENGTH=228 /DNA_ID=CAMNT_0038769523 /DNA_START=23 /DNA_END=709 /DNA_ORIENTATION=+